MEDGLEELLEYVSSGRPESVCLYKSTKGLVDWVEACTEGDSQGYQIENLTEAYMRSVLPDIRIYSY